MILEAEWGCFRMKMKGSEAIEMFYFEGDFMGFIKKTIKDHLYPSTKFV